MAFNPQFKINQMAKDMGLKSKELTDLLSDKGIGDVKCLKKARKSGRIAHNLECEISSEVYDSMEAELMGGGDEA